MSESPSIDENSLHQNEQPVANEVIYGFSQKELKDILEKPEWKSLSPNYSNSDALLPQQLNSDTINAVLETITAPSALDQFAPYHLIPERTIPEVGTLLGIGVGEQKAGYKLLTDTGKSLLVLLQRGYDKELEIPSDKRLYHKRGKTGTNDLVGSTHLSYSDFRTYLSLPLIHNNDKFGIHLQEWGGSAIEEEASPSLKKAFIRRVFNYVTPKGLYIDSPQDFNKRDHILHTTDSRNPLGIIDIHLSDQYRTEEEVIAAYVRRGRNDPYVTEPFYRIATAPRALLPFLPLQKYPKE